MGGAASWVVCGGRQQPAAAAGVRCGAIDASNATPGVDLWDWQGAAAALMAARHLCRLSCAEARLATCIPTSSDRHHPHQCPAVYRFKAAIDTAEGKVTMGHFREGRPTLMGALSNLFSGAASAVNPADVRRGDPAVAAQKADIFLALNASTVELADLGKWVGGCGRASSTDLLPVTCAIPVW